MRGVRKVITGSWRVVASWCDAVVREGIGCRYKVISHYYGNGMVQEVCEIHGDQELMNVSWRRWALENISLKEAWLFRRVADFIGHIKS